MSYQQFAYIYDQLMEDAPYGRWLDYLEKVGQIHQHSMSHVVDLGCGTGAITIPLAQKGLEVIGIDLSEDMLAVAQNKALNLGLHIQWLQQDLTQLELPYQVDTVLCFCDSLNYVLEEALIKQAFQLIHQHLQTSGLFVFDCHTPYKVEQVFGNHMFGSSEENLSYIWQSHYDADQNTVDHGLSFFIQEEDGRYRRFDESHRQKAFGCEELTKWLEEEGFEVLEQSADFEQKKPTETSERFFFVARKKS